MKTMKKIVAILAVALMLCSILPLSVFAAEDVTINTYAKTGTLSGTTSISWESGDYQVVSYKNTSTTAIRTSDADHFRYYVGNKLVISGKDGALMSKVVITCTGSSYMLNNASNTLGAGWTVSASGTTLTYTPDGGSASELTITIGKQSRSSKIVITPAAAAEPEEPSTCEHEWSEATCTTPKTCSACGETEGEALGHDWEIISEEDATCTADGSTTYECAACGEDKVETIPALPHNYVDGFCSACGEAEPLEATITFDNLNKMTSSSSTQQVWKENGIVVTYDKNTYNSNLAEYANPIRFYAGTKITISYPGITKVEIVANTTAYASAVKNALSGSTVNGTIVTYECEAIDSVSFVLTAQARVNSITVHGSAPSDCEHDYVGVETQAPTCSAEGVMTYTCSKCEDSYTEAIAVIAHNYVEDIIDSTCTTTGTKTYECSVCGNSYDEVIPVKPHNYVDDVCADCGAVKAYKGTIIFDADKTQRVDHSNQTQVWANEGLTFTNNKGASTTNVGDYGAPGRFYKNSQIIIEFSEMMSTLIIDASGVENNYLWDDTLEAAGLSFTVEDKIYTITFAEAVNSLELTAANQVRANSITAIVAHECAWTDATCTAPKTCSICGATEGDALKAVASIGDTLYASLADALADAANREIVLLADIELAAPIVIAKDEIVILDLNGFEIVYNSTVQNEAMITNYGTLTINDSKGTGVINYNYTGAADPTYRKGNYTISNSGNLTVNGGKITIANLRSHAKYPIDNNSTTGNAVLVINGGHLYNYNTSAIRMFCNSTVYKNIVTINGGLIEGYCAIWVQNPGKNTVNAQLSITNGEIKTTASAYVNGTAELKDVSSSIYCTTEGGDWDENSLVSITGGVINENIYLATDAPASLNVEGTATFNGRLELPCAHTYDNDCDADCNVCGEGREVGDHTYAHDFDVDCDICGAVRAVAGPVSFFGKSVSEECNGLAFLFDVEATGFAFKDGSSVEADYTNATYKGYKLLEVGVIASNGVSELTITGERIYDLEDTKAQFAFRIIKIPADKLDVTITMTPYYIVEIEGESVTLYGEAQSASYSEVAAQ